MVSNKYRLRDVPKGKKLEHFFTYYKPHLFYAIVFSLLIGYTVYGLLKPKPDLQVMWLSGAYTMECEQELRENCAALEWDTNGDGVVTVTVTQVDFGKSYEEMSYAVKSELVALIAAQDYSFFLVNDNAMAWMRENEILGTYGDAGLTDFGGEEEYLCIPVEKLGFLRGKHDEPLEGLYLCVTPTPEQDQDRQEAYKRQMEALRRALAEHGLSATE